MDIILGMNWMAVHRVTLDIASRAVERNSPSHGATTLYLPSRECIISYAFMVEGVKPEDIPVVCEYADVFPDGDIEFIIELQPGTASISKRPYRMPPKELAEFKLQL
jgi:hypothetical protein